MKINRQQDGGREMEGERWSSHDQGEDTERELGSSDLQSSDFSTYVNENEATSSWLSMALP